MLQDYYLQLSIPIAVSEQSLSFSLQGNTYSGTAPHGAFYQGVLFIQPILQAVKTILKILLLDNHCGTSPTGRVGRFINLFANVYLN